MWCHFAYLGQGEDESGGRETRFPSGEMELIT